MNRKSLSQLNSRRRRRIRAKKFLAILSAIAVFVTTYALILPAITIDDETAENEPGLDVVQTIEEDPNDLTPPPSEPADVTDDVSRSATCGDLTVGAELTDGSFGAGVVMELTALDDLNVLNAAVAAVDGVNNREAEKVRAVEISFTDENGEDGTPEAPMNITLSGEAISDASDPVVVRVDENGDAEIVDGRAIGDEILYLSGERSSILAIVETHEITTKYMTADGETYDISVKYDTTAGIPDGATLSVTEIDADTEEYASCLGRAYDQITAGRVISEARFFDISIIYEGNEIEPLTDVEVTIAYDEPMELDSDSEVLAVHFTDAGTELNSDVDVATGANGGTEVTFTQGGFSTTGTLRTNTSSLSYGSNYVIVAYSGGKYYAVSNTGELACPAVEVDITIDGNNVTFNNTSVPDPTCIWIYNYRSGTGTTLQNKSSNRYLSMSSSTSISSSSVRAVTLENSNGKIKIRNGNYRLALSGSNFVRTSNGTELYFIEYNKQGEYQIRYHYIDENGNEIYPPYAGGNVMNMSYSESAADMHSSTYAIPINGYTFKEARYGDPEGDRFHYITNEHNSSNNAIIINFMNDLMYNVNSNHSVQTGTYQNTSYALNVTDRVDLSTDSDRVKDVYMVYVGNDTPKPNDNIHAGEGGGGDEGEFPFGAPDHNKRLERNYTDGKWDGTYTLYLDVTGQAATQSGSNKADIILVYDTSNSMHSQDATDSNGNNTYRYRVAYDVVMDVAQELFANNANDPDPNDPTVRIGVVSYACSAKQEFTYANSYSEFANGFSFANQESTYQKSTYGGTNWEDGLQTAMAMYNAGHRDGVDQYVIFVSDGEPTCRVTYGDWYEHRDAYEYTFTNGNAGPDHDQTNNNKEFIAHGYGTLNNGNYLYTSVEHCYTHAKDDAKAFVDAGVTFIDVGIFNSAESLSRMNTLANYAYSGLDYPELDNDNYKYAENETILHEMFADIIHNITKNFTYDNVDILDVMTATTLTTGEISGAGNAVDFKYYKNPKNGTLTEWQGAPAATYDPATRSVNWDLDSIGALEDGVTYTLGFTVWPDQDAYDAIMLLNDLVDANVSAAEVDAFAAEHYPDIAPLLRKDSSGHYIVQSNANAVLSYERFITENGETTSLGPESAGYSYPNMETTSHYMKVSKYWQDSLQTTNRFQSVTFAVYQDYDDTPGATNIPYTYVTLDASNADDNDPHAWVSDNIEISPGIFKTEIDPNNPINPGHTYTVKEIGYRDSGGNYHEINSPDDYTDYRYEFNPEVITPMLYDGVMTLMGDANEDQRLTGVNALRGGINLYKYVLGRDGEPIFTEDEYEFIVHFDIPERFIIGYGENDEPIYDPNAYPLWYTMYTDNDYDGYYFGEGDTNGVTNGLPDLGGGWGTLSDGDHVKIKANQSIRIINVPIGTVYSFEEINVPNGWAFQHAEVELLGEIVETQTGPDGQGRNRIEYAAQSDAAHENIFYNIMTHYEIKVHKVDEDNNTVALPGAIFEVYSAPGQDPNDLVTINGQTQHTTDADGYISLGEDLPNGTYYIYEVSPPPGYEPLTDPIVVTIDDSGVTYEQTEQSSGATQTAPLTPGTNAPIYTVTVVNEPASGLQIIKVNAADPTVVLAGAVFNLYKAPDGVSEEDLINSTTGIVDKDLLTIVSINDETDLTSNSNGVISLGGNLPPGVYYLFEITPPTGFAAPKDPVKITVNGTTVTYSQKDYNAGQTMTAQIASSGNDPPALTIFVANTTGIQLPHTGGAGTFMYTFGGITLMCIAVLTYGIGLKRKKRERRNE